MTSYSGSVAYLSYVSKTDKGGVKKGDLFNGVFGLGDNSEARTAFTSQVIVESGKVPSLTVAETHRFEGDKNIKAILEDGSVKYVDAVSELAGDTVTKIAYFSEEFQMERVPAEDIPTIGPKMEHIALVAEPRRIAVRYDQITAFQA